MNIRIFPPDEILETVVTLPLSKSLINRLAVIRALTPDAPPLPREWSESCIDARVISAAAASDSHDIEVSDSASALRLLTAYYAAKDGAEVRLSGSERLCRRPVGPLVDALRQLGADIEYEAEEGYAPLRIRGRRLRGGQVKVDCRESSQYVSALMLVAPTMQEGLQIHLDGEPVSLPYILLTAETMASHGVECAIDRQTLTIPSGTYTYNPDYTVEADWSAATYWYEVSVLSGGFVSFTPELQPTSLQADRRVVSIFEELGVHTDFDGEDGNIDLQLTPDQSPRLKLNMADCPDLVPTVAITAALLGIPFDIGGISTLRLKESDRVDAIITELRRLGIFAEWTAEQTLSWDLQRMPLRELPRFDAHGDHRIAMALAPAALFLPGIVIEGAEAVSKSYPGYWEALQRAGFTITDGDAPYSPEEGMPLNGPGDIRASDAVL